MPDERILSGGTQEDDPALEVSLRPRRIDDYIGQDRIKDNLRIAIAHVQGGESVGSLVSFVDGIPFKSGYRRYRIREVQGIDDFAMIREVVRRRFKREDVPDVLLVDGGIGQFNAAKGAGAKARVLLSLAKREELLFHQGRPLPLDRSTPAMRLLMYVRDEAHRFAQHYHHVLRRKAVLEEE